jgi:hypothetical protein
MPGKRDDALAAEVVVLVPAALVVLVLAAASGPPRRAACHWSGVAQPLTPASRSASAANAIAM